MTPRGPNRLGVTTGDILIALAVLSLLAALVYPTLRARAFRGLVDSAVAEVEVMRSAAQGVFSRTGSWPAPGAPGEIPPELGSAFPGDSTLTRAEYTLEWKRWEVVGQVRAPPSAALIPADADAPPDTVGPGFMPVVHEVGAIVVLSGNDDLLAELLSHYGSGVSFARGTTWTLVVDDVHTPPGG
jgi:type II secretory pathway pseudopilin PulG